MGSKFSNRRTDGEIQATAVIAALILVYVGYQRMQKPSIVDTPAKAADSGLPERQPGKMSLLDGDANRDTRPKWKNAAD